MKFISIIGLMSELEKVVNTCGSSENFHPDDVFSFYSNTKKFVPVSDENPYSDILKRLTDIVSESGETLEIVDIEGFEADYNKINGYIDYVSDKLADLIKKKKELRKQLSDYREAVEQISHFSGLEINFEEILSCEYIKFRFGRLPTESYYKLSVYDENPDIMFFPCTNNDLYHWGLYFAPIEKLGEIDRIFSGLYFERIYIPRFGGTVEERIKTLESLSKQTEDEISKIDKKIKAFWDSQRNQCMRIYSKLEQLNTYYGIRKYAARYNDSFILVGWIPADSQKEFCRKLSSINSVEYSTETGKNILSHSPPVKLKNRKVFRPFEFFVDTYGLPSYHEIDPTVFVAVTYTVLFGIMFADLGQGLVVSIAGYFMWKLKKMKLGKILISCGLSSAVFGTIFGSVFGIENALDSFYRNVFGLADKPVDVMSSGATNLIIYSAVGIGIGLLMLAMVLNIYSSIRCQNYGEAIFGPNGMCGLIFYTSCVLFILDFTMLHTGMFNEVYISLFILFPIVLIMFNEVLAKLVQRDANWQPENWGDYLAQSIFELFEIVLSYVTNTMSFLRVGAFVLVHAGMMMVVFTIAEMFGTVGYTITVILGNIFVIFLEALLAGIQVLRLEFYEMFSRFFEGQGRPFHPVTIKK